MALQLKDALEWGVGRRSSIRYKIIRCSFVLFSYFTLFFFFFLFIFKIPGGNLVKVLIDLCEYLLVSFLTFLFIILSLKYILNKHLFDRFKSFEEEMREIKKGNFSKRLTVSGFDEIDELVYFTNTVLDNFEEKLKFEENYSLRDPLTLCYNRRALKLSFEKFSARARRGEKVNLNCFYFDLDFFKKVNDKHGHNVGDEVLKKVTNIVTKNLRAEDILYRVGGEEFIVLFFDLTKLKRKKLIERLQKQITYEIKKELPNVSQEITISGGIVNSKNFDLRDENSLDEMVNAADALLYKAKESGRNKIIFGD